MGINVSTRKERVLKTTTLSQRRKYRALTKKGLTIFLLSGDNFLIYLAITVQSLNYRAII